jgi:hypothetical protein
MRIDERQFLGYTLFMTLVSVFSAIVGLVVRHPLTSILVITVFIHMFGGVVMITSIRRNVWKFVRYLVLVLLGAVVFSTCTLIYTVGGNNLMKIAEILHSVAYLFLACHKMWSYYQWYKLMKEGAQDYMKYRSLHEG